MEIQLATTSINNEDQNTQKEADIPGGNENKNDELVIEIEKMFKRPEIQSSTQCLIHKVPCHLRKWKEEAYTPQVVSIGPFHHKDKRLKSMEEYKERYFKSFVQSNRIDLKYFVGIIREMEEIIRGCYAETIDLSSDRFVKMILVDACFILELLRRRSEDSRIENSILVNPKATAMMYDLLLLENQLPFFVIEKLHHLAFPSSFNADSSNYGFLLELSLNYFRSSCFEFRCDPYLVKIEHFTDLLRTFLLPPPEEQPKKGFLNIDHLYPASATQLHEAGVKFKFGGSESGFDIKFEKGVLKIPTIKLGDWTEVVTRNIMALEQTRYIENGYFTDYFFVMDLLINTREDVDLLCDKKILVNYLGDKNTAKSMINNLNKGIIWKNMRDDYIDLCKELNSFYENP